MSRINCILVSQISFDFVVNFSYKHENTEECLEVFYILFVWLEKMIESQKKFLTEDTKKYNFALVRQHIICSFIAIKSWD